MDVILTMPLPKRARLDAEQRQAVHTMAFNVLVWALDEVDTTKHKDHFAEYLSKAGSLMDKGGINVSALARKGVDGSNG